MSYIKLKKTDISQIVETIPDHYTLFIDTNETINYVDENDNISIVNSGIDLKVYNGTSSNATLTQREKYRFTGFLGSTNDDINNQYIFNIDENRTSQFNSSDMGDISGVFKLILDPNKVYVGNQDGVTEHKTISELLEQVTYMANDDMFHTINNTLELLVEKDFIILGDGLNRGRPSNISNAIEVISRETGSTFKIGFNNQFNIDLPNGQIIMGDSNNEGVGSNMISSTNSVVSTNSDGDFEYLSIDSFFDLLTVSGVTSSTILNTLDMTGNARGVRGSWRITNFIIENTTGNVVTINIGTVDGGNDVLSGFSVGSNFFGSVNLLKTIFSKTVEQSLHISSSNWNGSNLVIKISVKKIF